MDSLHVVLVEPEIPWNAGNAGRTCLAAGARLHLVEPLGFFTQGRDVRRAGLDYWEHVRPTTWPSWEALEARLPDLGEPYFFAAHRDAARARPYWDATYPERVVLVFGRESVGLPEDLLARHRDRVVTIPMRRDVVRSLNVSTCVGLAVYEVLRQRRREPSR
jgi:tRNA (cytidine/uridine-2'-O-)-methyltransferase